MPEYSVSECSLSECSLSECSLSECSLSECSVLPCSLCIAGGPGVWKEAVPRERRHDLHVRDAYRVYHDGHHVRPVE